MNFIVIKCFNHLESGVYDKFENFALCLIFLSDYLCLSSANRKLNSVCFMYVLK